MNREEILDKILRKEALTDLEQLWWKTHGQVKDELDFLLQMEAPLRLEHRKLLKSQLQAIEISDETALPASESIRQHLRLKTRKWLAIAASVSIVLIVVLLLMPDKETRLIAEYFEPYPSIVNPVLKGGEASSAPFVQGMAEYQNQRYQESLRFFEQISVQNDTTLFYQANSMLALKRNDEALKIFESLRNHNNRFRLESTWYVALTRINLRHTNEARLLLEDISGNPAHPYFSEATDLLKKIQ